MAGRRELFWPLLIFTLSIATAVALSVGYTTWAIGYHSRQVCAPEQIMAASTGAITPYDKAVRSAFQRIYDLRCR